MTYEAFIAGKVRTHSFESCPRRGAISQKLYPFQRLLVDWALRRGRAALFEDCGLGKTFQQVEWAHHVTLAGRVLILAPLAVAEQTVLEAQKLSVPVVYARRPSDTDCPIVITNYDLLEHFVGEQWAGVVLDESGILKAYDGKTRNEIITSFADVPFRLACTATPAPNDFTELGNHSEFLGVKKRTEMLSEFFVHDSGETQEWRLKGHATEAFWRWVCTWAAAVKRPSDIGFDDGAYNLPPLEMIEHVIDVDHADAKSQGLLFAPDVRTLADQRATRRMTMSKRVQKAAELCAGNETALVWAELNDEADACEDAIADAVQVKGSDSPEDKSARMLGFAAGKHRVLVSKSRICGHGLNFQTCHKMVFLGASHSFEQTYQAIRRCWRFGQTNPVEVHIIRAETEGAIVANYKRKETQAEELSDQMVALMRDAMADEIAAARRENDAYQPSRRIELPRGLVSEVA